MEEMTVNLEKESYPIYIGKEGLNQLEAIIDAMACQKIGLITDETVNELYGEKLEKLLSKYSLTKTVVQSGEQSKDIKTYHRLLEEFISAGFNREDLIITLGGGVVGDLGGFVAATLFRGIRYLQIPTTLLAQLDSSIGGKVAINSAQGKNLIGAFHQPQAVVINPEFLQTLDAQALKSGLGELIKHAMIASPALVKRLEAASGVDELFEHMEAIIAESLQVKKNKVEADVFDKGQRMVLNFGHTIGHAIEKKYAFNELSHGEAVGIGMAEITKLSEAIGWTQQGTYQRLVALLEKYNLRSSLNGLSEDVTLPSLTEAILKDKKILKDEIHLVILKEVGQVTLKTLSLEELKEFLGVE